jgi:hypothetical protein
MPYWVDTPHHLPRKCGPTGQSTEEAGPYLDTGFRYFDPDPNAAATGQLHLNTLYLSKLWLESVLNSEGSPFYVMTTADYARLLAGAKAKDVQIAALEARVAELEAGAPVTLDQASLRLLMNGTEDAPASRPPTGSTDPDDHDSAPKRRTPRKKAAA